MRTKELDNYLSFLLLKEQEPNNLLDKEIKEELDNFKSNPTNFKPKLYN